MEKITTFVENLFFDFPRTEEIARLKMQIIDSLVEKYQALLNSGKNENEAFGILIAEFGSMEELKKQFNIPSYKDTVKENKQERSNNTQNKNFSFKNSDPIRKIIMLSAVIVFLLLGFLKNLWHPAWLVFPIGALLSLIIEILITNFKQS